jgi:hypothetical protein
LDMQFLIAIADPNHVRHEEFTQWQGSDFDPNDLDVQAELRRGTRRMLPA